MKVESLLGILCLLAVHTTAVAGAQEWQVDLSVVKSGTLAMSATGITESGILNASSGEVHSITQQGRYGNIHELSIFAGYSWRITNVRKEGDKVVAHIHVTESRLLDELDADDLRELDDLPRVGISSVDEVVRLEEGVEAKIVDSPFPVAVTIRSTSM